MTSHFVEQRSLDTWSPVVIHGSAPATVAKNGKLYLRRADGLGRRIRSAPKEIRPEDEGKSLAELDGIYGEVAIACSTSSQPSQPAQIAEDRTEDDCFYKPSYGAPYERSGAAWGWVLLVTILTLVGLAAWLVGRML